MLTTEKKVCLTPLIKKIFIIYILQQIIVDRKLKKILVLYATNYK